MMRNVRGKRAQTAGEVAAQLARLLSGHLAAGKKVLWLVSGGSSIPVAAAAARLLRQEGADTAALYVALVDDLYDPAGQTSTNWQKLHLADFDAGRATVQGILPADASSDKKLDPNHVARQFDQLLQERLDWADVTIGQFGLGDGFHTGGILADSVAARETIRLAVAYEHAGTYKITVTPALIGQLDVVFINSVGENKRPLVKHFLTSAADTVAEPTQSLKTAAETYLYSDVLPENPASE